MEAQVPIHPVAEKTEINAWVGGERAAKGVNLPLGDLIRGDCALELGHVVGTHNIRDFGRIPGLKIIRL